MGKTYKESNLKKFFHYYKKQKIVIILLVIVMLLASSLGMVLPFVYSERLVKITELNLKGVLIYSSVIIGVIVSHHIFWFLWEKIASILSNRVGLEIRKDLIKKITDTNYQEIKNKTSGYYLERMNDDVIQVASFLSNVLGTLVDGLTNFSFLIIIYIFNYQCGLIFTIGIIILYRIDCYKIKKDLEFVKKLKVLNEKFSSKMNEEIKGIKDIKGLGIKSEIITEISNIAEKIANETIKKDRTFAFYSRIKTFCQYLLEAILIVYAVGILIPQGSITVVILLTIINYSGFMYDMVGFIANTKDFIVKAEYKAKRLLEILENKRLDNFGDDASKIEKYDIRIKNLSYCYEDNLSKEVLKNLSLAINENTANIFVGHSGSGKSTLFGLITKIINIDNGKIFIGGKDINSFSENNLRNSMTIVNQEPFLLNDTILNNIKIVKKEATKEEVERACKIANIYADINNFAKKYNTIINENGNNLSGGQKQRLAIARAILKDAPIILFDEPTSALDKNNQKLFYDTIKELKKEKTLLIIDHKIDDYSLFDNVFQLSDGEIEYIARQDADLGEGMILRK